MGGKSSRDKGGRGEREVLELLRPTVAKVYGRGKVELRRNSNHGFYKTSRADCAGLEWLSLEVKFHAHVIPYKVKVWWKQTLEQTKPGQLPVLFYRGNNEEWSVRWRVGNRVVNSDVREFVKFFKTCCQWHRDNGGTGE